jgi:hypothetical protein
MALRPRFHAERAMEGLLERLLRGQSCATECRELPRDDDRVTRSVIYTLVPNLRPRDLR